MHDAVLIDGIPYWDGGFRGNPPIWPFIYASESRDVVMVELDPSFRPGVPRPNAEVADRLNEITFGGALMAEMRAIAFIQDMIEKGAITEAAPGTVPPRMRLPAMDADHARSRTCRSHPSATPSGPS